MSLSRSREKSSVTNSASSHGPVNVTDPGISTAPTLTQEIISTIQAIPNIQTTLGELSEYLRVIKELTQGIKNIKNDLWEEDGFDFRISHIAEQQEVDSGNIQVLKQENKMLKEDIDMLKSVVINLDRTVRKQQSEITDLKIPGSRNTFANIHRNGPKNPGRPRTITGRLEKFTDKEKVLQAQKDKRNSEGSGSTEQSNTPFYITPHRPVEVAENRKKLQEISNRYWKENVKTRFVGDKLVFPNGNTYKEKVLKPKPENILLVDQAEKEALQQIQMSTLETSTEGNDFKIAASTTATFNQVRNFYKKVVMDSNYSNADHNILVYRFTDKNGLIHEGYNDDGEHGAGRRLLKDLQYLHVTDMTCIISRFFGKYLGYRRFQIMENLAADIVLAHRGETLG
ncbi:protein IMPACT homolog [Ostrea edulis]|uniref:protein IMPACT homolog n=1 Tax=Ostrea edulis TaxID=37623 RepID=UPI0024AE8EAC|nr:protein IMPACT homolog [Ostrea edulis]